jgi:hypothetical protein
MKNTLQFLQNFSRCVRMMDEAGEVLLEQRLATTPKAMKEAFGSMPRCRISLETGMHSPGVSQVLGAPPGSKERIPFFYGGLHVHASHHAC